MDRLETAKLHKAIDQVLEDHVSMLKPTRVMIRELILDAIEGAELKIVSAAYEINERRRKGLEAINSRATPEDLINAAPSAVRLHPLDYGKSAVHLVNPVTFNERNGDGPQDRPQDGWLRETD